MPTVRRMTDSLGKEVGEGKPCILLLEIQINTTITESSMEISEKFNQNYENLPLLSKDLAISLLDVKSKCQRTIHTSVFVILVAEA